MVLATTHELPISTELANKQHLPFPAKHMSAAYGAEFPLLESYTRTHRLV